MPVEQRDPRQLFKAVGLGLGAVAAAVGFLLLVLWFTDRGTIEIALGDDVFEAGRTDVLAPQIERGGPIQYGDLLGGARNIILQHLGSDESTGWYAFDLIRPGQADECPLVWQADEFLFRDACDDSVEVRPDGAGQPSYPVEVIEGQVVVDFRPDPES